MHRLGQCQLFGCKSMSSLRGRLWLTFRLQNLSAGAVIWFTGAKICMWCRWLINLSSSVLYPFNLTTSTSPNRKFKSTGGRSPWCLKSRYVLVSHSCSATLSNVSDALCGNKPIRVYLLWYISRIFWTKANTQIELTRNSRSDETFRIFVYDCYAFHWNSGRYTSTVLHLILQTLLASHYPLGELSPVERYVRLAPWSLPILVPHLHGQLITKFSFWIKWDCVLHYALSQQIHSIIIYIYIHTL